MNMLVALWLRGLCCCRRGMRISGRTRVSFLRRWMAGAFHEFLGKQGLGTNVWPEAKVPIFHTLSYYMHDGGHGTLPAIGILICSF